MSPGDARPAGEASAANAVAAGEERRKRIEIRRRKIRAARRASASSIHQTAAQCKGYTSQDSTANPGGLHDDFCIGHEPAQGGMRMRGTPDAAAASSFSAPAVLQQSHSHWASGGQMQDVPTYPSSRSQSFPWRTRGFSAQDGVLTSGGSSSGSPYDRGSELGHMEQGVTEWGLTDVGSQGAGRSHPRLSKGIERTDSRNWSPGEGSVSTDLFLGTVSMVSTSDPSQMEASSLSDWGISQDKILSGTSGNEREAGGGAQVWHPAGEVSSKKARGSSSTDDCPPHGMLSVLGRRRDMEDAMSVLPYFTSVPRQCTSSMELASEGSSGDRGSMAALHFFGIYDGHGGIQAAKHCAERMHLTVADELKQAGSDQSPFPPLEEQLQRSLTLAFRKMDDEIGGKCPRPEGCGQRAVCQHNPIAPEAVGTTAVVAVIGPSQIVVGNCGDSRAVLCRGGRAVPLSEDHKPDREDERKRVEAAGGRVIYCDGYRVLGVLAMSRAIGDRCLKPFVIAEPDVKWVKRTEGDECIVMGTDGLWDVMNNEEACNIASRCLMSKRVPRPVTQPGSPFAGMDPQAATAAALLTKVAMTRGSGDNITVIVIDLIPRESG